MNSDKVPPAQQGKARQVQVGIKDNGGIQKQENIVSNVLLIFMLNSKRHLFVGSQFDKPPKGLLLLIYNLIFLAN